MVCIVTNNCFQNLLNQYEKVWDVSKLRISIYVIKNIYDKLNKTLFLTAGQTAGPNGLKFFYENPRYPGGNIG